MAFTHWAKKFRNAFRGVYFGMQGQSSFLVHLPVACAVWLAAWYFACTPTEWLLLTVCVGMVVGAELMNSALESLARGLCDRPQADVGRALDIASGAVLIVALTAVVVGLSIFVSKLF